MREDFLHYIWKYKKFNFNNLQTIDNESIEIIEIGQHNQNSGPDFFNAQLRISNQLWAGNVEIHLKSSDWFLHNHETDSAYDNVILHVVWEHDSEVFRKDNSKIPTLVLKGYVTQEVTENYQKLMSKNSKWINCENDLKAVDDFTINNWMERVFFERLERKSNDIEILLKASSNNWEAVLYKMLTRSFGLKVNSESFLSLANSIDFSIVRKLRTNLLNLEALFFGQAGLLEDNLQEAYYLDLKNEYNFLQQKFGLSNTNVIPFQYFRLRPSNFPTIRLSQLANLYHQNSQLFSKIIEITRIEEFYNLFRVETSEFWQTHYTFAKESKRLKKYISNSFIDLLVINTVVPIKFSYAKYLGKSIEGDIIDLISSIASEKNRVVEKFNQLKPVSNSALFSQGIIQLKSEYCDKNKCLQCAIGSDILTRND